MRKKYTTWSGSIKGMLRKVFMKIRTQQKPLQIAACKGFLMYWDDTNLKAIINSCSLKTLLNKNNHHIAKYTDT